MSGFSLPYVMVCTALGLLFTGCGEREPTVLDLTGQTMGTSYSVRVVEPSNGIDRDELRGRIAQVLSSIERLMSTYMADSELSRFNAHEGTDWFAVSTELCDVVAAAQQLSVTTGGAFDVTVGPLVNLWGFGPDEGSYDIPAPIRVEELLLRTGNDLLHADCAQPALSKTVPSLYVDLSAFAKGYGVDKIAALLDNRGVRRYLVEVGGELKAAGLNAQNRPWRIAIEAPHRGTQSVGRVIGLSDRAMATSGDYRIFFERAGRYYSHIIDPRSGQPVAHDAAAVTVLADSATVADGLATALMVLGPVDGLQFAERNDLAALFQVRSGDGVREHMSTRFENTVASR